MLPTDRHHLGDALADMVIELRRTLIATRFSGSRPAQPAADQIRAVLTAWDAAAA
jgi:hypothetical protein